MKRNVGPTDRKVRLVAGAALGITSLGILLDLLPLPSVASPALGVVALILLATGASGTCGLYSLVGVNTDRSP
jgi:hypothetical protein